MSAQPSPAFNTPIQPHTPDGLFEGRFFAPHPSEIIREDYFGNARLRRRVALIAGAAGDLGRSIAAHYAREGARLVLVHDDDQHYASECERLIHAEGADCLLVDSDLCDMAECARVISEVVGHYGHLDVLVNCADSAASRATPRRGSRHPTSGSFLLLLAAMAVLGQGGVILNVACVPDRHEGEALQAYTRSLAEQAAGHAVRVNAIVSGPLRPPVPVEFLAGHVPFDGWPSLVRRAGQPADIGPACVFLACDDASFINGQTLHVDGGQAHDAPVGDQRPLAMVGGLGVR